MASEDKNIILHEGLPDRQLIEEWSVDGDCLLVLDDLKLESVDSKDITYLFTIGSHHKRAKVIIMSHNVFTQGKQLRTISLNSHYFIIFQNRLDDNQIKSFSRQLYPGNPKYLVSAYKFCMANYKHYYILIDLIDQFDRRTILSKDVDISR
jgi:hypothetical protein